MVQKILQAFEFVFGCWHFKLSRPFTLSGRTYEVCLDCGKQFAYARADLGQQFWPEKLDGSRNAEGTAQMRITQVWQRDQRNRDWRVPPSNACSAGDALRVESAEITARLVNMSCGERAVREMNRDQRTNLRDFMGWRCGSCNQLITRVDNGWVEWLASEDDCGESESVRVSVRPLRRPVRERAGGLLPIQRPQRVPQQSDHCRRSEPGTAGGTGWAHGAVVAISGGGPPKSANHRTNETVAYSRLRAKPQPLWSVPRKLSLRRTWGRPFTCNPNWRK